MKSKRIVITLIVTIMLFSTVACGTTNQAEESKSTDATTKEVTTTSTVAPTEATTTATEATTKKEEETDSHGHKLSDEVVFKFMHTSELSEETCKNIADFFKDKTITTGDIVDLSQINYKPEEHDCMQTFGVVMIDIIPHDWNSSNYLAPFEFTRNYTIEIEILYNSESLTIRKFIQYQKIQM